MLSEPIARPLFFCPSASGVGNGQPKGLWKLLVSEGYPSCSHSRISFEGGEYFAIVPTEQIRRITARLSIDTHQRKTVDNIGMNLSVWLEERFLG